MAATVSPADPAAVRAVLVKARERLSSPERWCQLASGLSAKGNHVGPRSRYARQWCLGGAVAAEMPKDASQRVRWKTVRVLESAIPDRKRGVELMGWNDAPGRTHAEVLALLDAAIAAAGGEG